MQCTDFRRVPDSTSGLTGKRTPILLKMVPMGDKMLLHWASPGSFDEPRMLELNVDDYVDDTARPDGKCLLQAHTQHLMTHKLMQ